MFKFVFNQNQKIWINGNVGTIIRVLVILVIFVSSMLNPDVVLADPVMGGSVGKTINIDDLLNILKLMFP